MEAAVQHLCLDQDDDQILYWSHTGKFTAQEKDGIRIGNISNQNIYRRNGPRQVDSQRLCSGPSSRGGI